MQCEKFGGVLLLVVVVLVRGGERSIYLSMYISYLSIYLGDRQSHLAVKITTNN